MKILLAPSETKTIYNDTSFKYDNMLFSKEPEIRKNILDTYNNIIIGDDKKTLQEMFGLKKESDINLYKQTIDENSSACKAIKLYTCVAFDHLDYSSLDIDAQNYIEKNVIIFSNLFGPILAGNNLPLYRLQQGKSIGDIKTQDFYKKHSSLLLDKFLENGDILDIRAGYYDKFYIPNKNYTTLKFLKDGNVVSHWAKAYRGKVLREIAKNNISNIKDFMALNIEGLQIVELQTKKNKTEIIYTIN